MYVVFLSNGNDSDAFPPVIISDLAGNAEPFFIDFFNLSVNVNITAAADYFINSTLGDQLTLDILVSHYH